MTQAATWGVPRNSGEADLSEIAFAIRIDDSLDAVLSGHKGSTEPSYAVAGMLWIDDTSAPWVLKLYDGVGNIEVMRFDPAADKIRHRWYKGADIASATALTLGGDGNYFDVTGVSAITSIGSIGVGSVIRLHFDASLTLTHHATNLILPGAANIKTAAGDEALFIEYDAGDWRCVSYQRADGKPAVSTLGAWQALASAPTTDLGSLAGPAINVTGTATISSFGTSPAGMFRHVRFDGVATLTYNVTSMILPGGSSIITAAGDTAVFVSEGAGNWRCLNYQRAGASSGGFAWAGVQAVSGSLMDFTGLPSGVSRITIFLNGVSTNGTGGLFIRIGDSGGIEDTGYIGSGSFMTGAATNSANDATGYLIPIGSAATVLQGFVTLERNSDAVDGWTASGVIGRSDTPGNFYVGGVKVLSGELDRVRIITSNAFDLGSINISYEWR